MSIITLKCNHCTEYTSHVIIMSSNASSIVDVMTECIKCHSVRSMLVDINELRINEYVRTLTEGGDE